MPPVSLPDPGRAFTAALSRAWPGGWSRPPKVVTASGLPVRMAGTDVRRQHPRGRMPSRSEWSRRTRGTKPVDARHGHRVTGAYPGSDGPARRAKSGRGVIVYLAVVTAGFVVLV